MSTRKQRTIGVLLSLLMVVSTVALASPAVGIQEATSNGDTTAYDARDPASVAATIAGEDNSTLSVNGSGYASAEDSASLDIDGQALTMEAWIKYNASSADDADILDKEEYGIRLEPTGSGEERRIYAWVNTDSGFAELFSSASVPAGRWTHVAVVYNGTHLKLYINGEVDSVTTLTGDVSTTFYPFRLGSDATFLGDFYSGRIDEVRVWETARSTAQIQANYPKELMGNEPGLVGYWRFNRLGGASVQSAARNRSTVALNGTTVAKPGSTPTPPDVFARNGNGTVEVEWTARQGTVSEFNLYRSTDPEGSDRQLVATLDADTTSFTDTGLSVDTTYFYHVTAVNADGQESDFSPAASATPYNERGGGALPLNTSGATYATVDDRATLDIDDRNMTLEAWIKYNASSADNADILTKDEYGIRFEGSGEERRIYAWVDTDTGFASVTSTAGVPADRWTHVAVVYNGTHLKLYINEEVDSVTTLTGNVSTTFYPFRLGSDATFLGDFYSGRIDEVRVWETARSTAQIQANYPKELMGNEPGLVGYWRFNRLGSDTIQSAARNRSTVALNGTTVAKPGSIPVPPDVFSRGGDGIARIEWTARQGTVSEFNLYRSTDPEGSDRQLIATLDADTTSFTDTGLSNDTTYFYHVTAVNADGRESDSPIASSALASEHPAGVAFDLNASDAHGTVSDRRSLDIDDANLTIEAWIKYNASSADNADILTKDEYGIRFEGSGEERRIYAWVDTDTGFASVTSTSTVFAENWTHVAAVYNGSHLNLYIDGELNATTTLSGDVLTTFYPFRLGSDATFLGDFYSGRIDEVRVWETARSTAQIQANYPKELIGNEDGLVAYWRGCNLPGNAEAQGATERRMTAALTNVTCGDSGAPVTANELPIAAFDHTPDSPEANETVTFNASSSSDPDGTITSYEWDVDNDGTFEVTGEEVTQAFSTVGEHSVTLEVTDNDGATDTSTQTVTVTRTGIQLNLTANATEITVGDTVAFTVTREDTGEPVNATIEINPTLVTGDDGQASHTFEETGAFTATASKANTSAETFLNDSLDVTVENETVQLDLTANETTVEPGDSVRFTVTREDTGDATNATIEIDGTTLTTGADGTVTHSFEEVGTFTATASKESTATEAFLNDSLAITVTVENETVQLNLTANETTVDPGDTVEFTVTRNDTGEAANATIEIDGTTLTTGEDGHATYTFEEVGTFTATASKVDTDVVTFLDDSVTITVEERRVQLDLSANTTSINVGETVAFTVTRQDTGMAVNATISIDDTTLHTGPDGTVTYTFDSAGEFTATATKSDTADEMFLNDSVTITVTAPESVTVAVVLDGAPAGLRKYNVTVRGPATATIEAVEPKLIAETFQIRNGGVGSSSVTARASDLEANVGSFNGTRTLFTVEFSGISDVDASSVTIHSLVDDEGRSMNASRVQLRLANPWPDGVPGVSDRPPTDPDGDGEYEDVNGDCEATFQDAIAFAFADFEAINNGTQRQINALDFAPTDGGNDRVEFADAIELSFEVPIPCPEIG